MGIDVGGDETAVVLLAVVVVVTVLGVDPCDPIFIDFSQREGERERDQSWLHACYKVLL